MKKMLSIIILACLSIVMCFTLTGCRLWAKSLKLPWYESGDYKYAVNTLKDGTKEAYLIGLTEQGSKQKYLVLPSEIDGIPVTQMGYFQSTGITGSFVPGPGLDASASKAERVYISEKCFSIKEEKTFFVADDKQETVLVFFSDSFFKSEVRSWHLRNPKPIVSIFILEMEDPDSVNPFPKEVWQLNNVSYMYNYIESSDKGYYWIDSWDNSLIDFIPPEPTRAGYTFDGWYKNKECSVVWDFDVDKTGNLIKYDESRKIDTSSEIFLYAKWLKI